MSRQLDFLSELLARVTGPRPVAKTPPPRGDDDSLAARCRELLHGLGCDDLAARVRVRWNARMRSTAGTAYPAKALITLNPRLHEFGAVETERTLRHELAHLLAQHRSGRRRIAPHGHEWRRACADLGLADERRCHDLPFPRRQLATRHFYRCPNCRIELRRVRPLRPRCACLACCRAHNHGLYDERFRFVKLRNL